MIYQTHRFYNNRLLFIFFSIFVGFITVAGVLGATRNPVADFDGDGKSDISVYRPSNGFWYIAKSSGGYSFVPWGISTDTPVPGDYDGDGRTDLAVFRRTSLNGQIYNHTWYILRSSDETFRAIPYISNSMWWWYYEPIPADYDADGKTDFAVYRRSDAIGEATRFFVLQSSTNSESGKQLGNNGIDNPVPADYDGDGRTDFAVYRRGTWSIVQSSNNTIRTEYFGLANDVFVPGDYDGDQKADIAVWRPSNGYWYWISSLDKSFISIQFGQSGDKPTPADYDGDGKTDVAVFRPFSGVWYLQQSSKGFRAEQFGLSGDVPIPNVFVRSLYSINFPGY